MGITYASPFSVNAGNNQDLLLLLKSYPKLDSISAISTASVPVSTGFDVSEIVSLNDKRIPSANSTAVKNEKDAEPEENGIEDDDTEPEYYVEVLLLEPRNRQQQLSTVLFQGFPALKKRAIEKVLRILLPSAFQWTVISNDQANDQSGHKNVFVRFSSYELVGSLRRNWELLQKSLPTVQIVCEATEESSPGGEAEEIKSELKETTDKVPAGSASTVDPLLQKAVTEISKVVGNTKNYGRGSNKSGTEDLDEVMQYYKSYKVESSELVEVPKDIKEKIVNDIIRFRSRVLTIERDRRKKEIEQERRKAKARLTRIFQGIKEAAVAESAADDAMEVEEETEVVNPVDSMTEAEYEKHLAEKAAQELEKEYAEKLLQLEKLEKTEQARLLEQLASARTYEENLIENKFTLMDDIKSFQDFDVDRINSNLSTKLQRYYNNHREYVRLRNMERAKEEAMDALDAENDVKDTSEKPVFSAPEVSMTEATTTEPSTDVNIVIAELPVDKLDSIKNKISDLVEEYLGIKENVLIDFVYDFLLEKNLGLKEELIGELQETLDEDSQVVVDQLHLHILAIRNS